MARMSLMPPGGEVVTDDTPAPAEPADTTPPLDPLTFDVALADMQATGATYRQLDYWSRCGFIQQGRPAPGSGQQRRWTYRDLLVVTLMLAMIEAGIGPRLAARYANSAIDQRSASLTLPSGLLLSWQRVPQPPIPSPPDPADDELAARRDTTTEAESS